MSAFLQTETLCKKFGPIMALNNISLTLHDRELLVVLGPTGAGKTTLLRTLAGLETPDRGTLHINNKDITHTPPSERDVALVFQNFSLYPNKTVRQNLAFPLQAPGRNLSQTDIDTQISHTANILHITHLLDRPATRLSGGEMQRVAIGRAIVRRPSLFLMDEPLTNLDAKLRETLRVELIRLQRDLGTPMIYVTHDQTEALSMADRIAVLSEGQILQMGTPEEIYRHPTSPMVARQLGFPPINLLTVHANNGQWHTPTGIAIHPTNEPVHKKATLGIRPENILLEGGATPAMVQIVEDLGPSTILLAQWANEPIHILQSGPSSCRPGDTIYPQIRPDQINLWPIATE